MWNIASRSKEISPLPNSTVRRWFVKWLVGTLLLAAVPSVGAQDIAPKPEGVPRPLPSDYFGYNGAGLLRGNSWSDPAFVRGVKSLQPSTLRYPGGTIANYWNWRSGGFLQDAELPGEFKKQKLNAVDLEDLQQGCQATGATPVFVLNLLTANLGNQLEMLRSAKRAGLPIRYIELGNEFYIGSQDNKAKFPSATDYANEANRWVTAIRKEFPEAKLAVVGAAPRKVRDPRWTGWNRALLAAQRGADVLTLHHYYSAGLPSNPFKRTRASAPVAFTADQIAAVLGSPFAAWKQFQRDGIKPLPSGLEVWITEYNMLDRGQPVHGTWMHGLGVSAATLLFLEEPKITRVINHVLVGNALFASIFSNETGFAALGDFTSPSRAPQTVPLSLTAGGTALQLIGNALQGMNTAQKLSFPGAPAMQGSSGPSFPSVLGWSFSRGSNSQVIVMNLSAAAQQLAASALLARGSYEQIAGDPLTLVNAPGSLRRTSGAFTGKITLPAYSITRLSS